ncbi:hypothetical protein ALC62_02455, partial [Cyphomyrmex costatus]
SINCVSIQFARLKMQLQIKGIKAEIIGLFFLAELFVRFIFHLFLLTLKRKKVKRIPRVSSNKLQIRVTNLRIKAYIDETFTQPICMCGVKCTYYEVGRRCEKDPYLNSSTTAVTVPYNPLKFVSPGQNVQNLYYYSHYSGSRTCLMGRSAIAEVASK